MLKEALVLAALGPGTCNENATKTPGDAGEEAAEAARAAAHTKDIEDRPPHDAPKERRRQHVAR
jgi:hypothetical protein